MIPFNKPFVTGKELACIAQAIASGKTAGNGPYTTACHQFMESHYGFAKCLLTTSGTDALEMAAILAGIQPGDEVIIPSYTFVSTALAFVRQGARIVFADSSSTHPNLDVDRVEPLITGRTKAIVPVHYAGVSCDMGTLMALARKHNLIVIADAAQAIDSYYTGTVPPAPFAPHARRDSGNTRLPLGGIGHFGCFSFHETKNIHCGEGGMLTINDPSCIPRAEIVWDRGTNRMEYLRGKVQEYEWVDLGSSFLPSELTAAFLWAQLQALREIQDRRLALWHRYHDALTPLAQADRFQLPHIPPYATNNAHMFYLLCASPAERSRLQAFLLGQHIQTATHYVSLHDSSFYRDKHHGDPLANCRKFAGCLLRLPLFCDLQNSQVDTIVDAIARFYRHSGSPRSPSQEPRPA